MKPTLLLVVLGAVAVIGANLIGSRDTQAADEQSSMLQVKDEHPLVEIKTNDPDVTVMVNKDSIREHELEGVSFRVAHIVYHLHEPKKVRGKEVHYLMSEVAYHCTNKLAVTVQIIALDKNADPLFKTTEVGEAEDVVDGSNAAFELNYVCNAKIKKTPPKSETGTKSKKFIDI